VQEPLDLDGSSRQNDRVYHSSSPQWIARQRRARRQDRQSSLGACVTAPRW
jgi:hypothetical protein